MKKRKMWGIFLLLPAVLALGGCARADVSLRNDGTGTASVAVSRAEGMTLESVREYADEVIAGVATRSAESERLTVRGIEEREDGFLVSLSFKNIAKLKGVGEFNFDDGPAFAGQINNRSLLNNFAKGKWNTLINYDNLRYEFTDDPAFGFLPKDAAGTVLQPGSFFEEGGLLSQKGSKAFTFLIAGLDLDEISFRLDGTVSAYAGGDISLDGDTVTLRPVTRSAKVLYYDEQENAHVETREVKVFAGYVIYRANPDYVPWIVLGCFLLLLGGGIAWGILSGFFRRVHRSRAARWVRSNWGLYLMILPGFVLLLLFNYLPMSGLVLAFKNYDVNYGIFGSEWARMGGFEHFFTMFTSEGSKFGLIFRNTIVLAVLRLIFGFTGSILLALLLNALKNGLFKRTVQTISYLPYFISWIVISGMSYLFLSSNGGILNNLIQAAGGDPVRWYSEPKYWWAILTLTSVWKGIGWGTIVYLAAITAISPDLYEAASIDGVTPLKQVFYITLPGMMPVIGITLILNVGALIKDDFDQIYAMVGNADELRDTTEVFSSLIYRTLRSGPSGYSAATAVGLFQSVVSLILVIFSNYAVKKTDNPGLF